MKLHLDKPRDEETDRQALLDFWDNFPLCNNFGRIKPKHFKRKAVRKSRYCRSKQVLTPEQLIMGHVTDFMDLETSAKTTLKRLKRKWKTMMIWWNNDAQRLTINSSEPLLHIPRPLFHLNSSINDDTV